MKRHADILVPSDNVNSSHICRARDGEGHREGGASCGGADEIDAASGLLENIAADEQAQAGAGLFGREVGLEEQLLLPSGDAISLVPDQNAYAIVARLGRQLDHCSLLSRIEGIQNQIQENLQHAVALGLGADATHYAGLAAAMAPGRARLADGLRALGVEVVAGAGTYFLVADVAAWMRPDEDDVGFARRLVTEAGVVVIPMSAFYAAAPPRSLVRFCFCKDMSTIEAALARLGAWRAR